MNAFRIIGVFLISVLLLVSLVSFGTTETLEKSTTLQNIKNRFTDITKKIIKDSINLKPEVDNALPLMQLYCVNHSKYEFPLGGYSFTIPCNVINKGSNNIIDHLINKIVSTFIESYYNKTYNCNFISCINQEGPLVLASEKAHNYWKNKSDLFFFVSIGLAVVLFLLTKHKSNFFVISGSLMIGTSLYVSILPKIASEVVQTAYSPTISTLQNLGISSKIFGNIASVFFYESESVYLWFLLIGILLIGTGIVFKMFKLGINIFKKSKSKKKPKKTKNKKKSK